jgi:hypothetical protein
MPIETKFCMRGKGSGCLKCYWRMMKRREFYDERMGSYDDDDELSSIPISLREQYITNFWEYNSDPWFYDPDYESPMLPPLRFEKWISPNYPLYSSEHWDGFCNYCNEKYHGDYCDCDERFEKIQSKTILKILELDILPNKESENEESELEQINYKQMKVVELKKLCKEKKIKGYSKLRKKELIEILKNYNCNVINKFLDNECELEENQKYFTHCGRLYSTFQEYCKNNNENCLTKNEFEGILLEKNIKHVKNDYNELGFNVKLINEF